MMSGMVMLSFDVEEFDLPKEHGAAISVEKGAAVSAEGLKKILAVLKANRVKATFFTTVDFAKEQPELVRRIVEEGHELAGHGVNHFITDIMDARECRNYLNENFGVTVDGWRQPRMQKVDYGKLHAYGYRYDSSINPAFILGRYNNLFASRKPYIRKQIVEIPTSVATFLRIPLFWLSLHFFPIGMYLRMAEMSLKKTGYFATYFHPWEFTDLRGFQGIPGYVTHNGGDKLAKRLDRLVKELKKRKHTFVLYRDFAKQILTR